MSVLFVPSLRKQKVASLSGDKTGTMGPWDDLKSSRPLYKRIGQKLLSDCLASNIPIACLTFYANAQSYDLRTTYAALPDSLTIGYFRQEPFRDGSRELRDAELRQLPHEPGRQ